MNECLNMTLFLTCVVNLLFIFRGLLGTHVRMMHKDLEGKWPCPICKSIHRSHHNLYMHIFILHESGQFHCAYPSCNFGPTQHRQGVYILILFEINIQNSLPSTVIFQYCACFANHAKLCFGHSTMTTD